MSKKIMNVTVKQLYDEDPDTSYLGNYTDRPEPWAIICQGEHEGKFVCELRAKDKLPRPGRKYNYFIAVAGDETPGTKNYRKYAKQDYERMDAFAREDWNFIGLRAEAKVQIGDGGLVQTITSGGLWGIESDSGKDELSRLAREQMAELESQLLALGFTRAEVKRATKTAIKDMA